MPYKGNILFANIFRPNEKNMNKHRPRNRRSPRIEAAIISKMNLQWPRDPSAVDRKSPFFLAFPQELFLSILDYLPAPGLVSLALTCKGLMRMLFPENALPRLSEEDLVTFLSTLQKDISGAYLCFCCHKLRQLVSSEDWIGHDHKWTIGFFQNPTWNIISRNNWHVPAPYYFSSFKDYFYVDFMDAYLVMNRHFLGASHGLPLDSLERYVSFQDHIELHNCRHNSMFQDITNEGLQSPPGFDYHLFERKEDEPLRKETAWRISFQMTPKIVHDKLYLGRFYTIVGPLLPWSCMARLISSCSPEICNHLKCLADARLGCCALYGPMLHSNPDTYLSIITRSQNRQGNLQSLNFSPESGSCQLCNTDYDVSLHQNKEKKEWCFRLSTYHCLGSCRSPNENFWKCLAGNLGRGFATDMSGPDGGQSEAGVYRLELPCGNVRQKWCEGRKR